MAAKICDTCGTPVKKLKHTELCQCGTKILTAHPSARSKKTAC